MRSSHSTLREADRLGRPPLARRPAGAAAGAPLEFSLAHLTMLAVPPPELTVIAARAGYRYVSFRPIAMGNPGEVTHPLGTDPHLLRRTRAELAATGVKLLDIELARIHDDMDIESYRPAMEAAAELGGKHVLTSGWSSNRAFVLERFQTLCAMAAPLGLTVDFEFVTFAEVRTLAEAADIVRASGCANAGILVDSLHFDRCGGRLEQLDALPHAWLHYAQLCDGPKQYSTDVDSLKYVAREARLYVGEGGVDVAGMVQHLPRMPYSLEIPNSRRLAELGPLAYARRCLVTAQQQLESVALLGN